MYAGQFLSLMLSASHGSRNLTASRSTSVRSLKSRTIRRPSSDASSLFISGTFSESIRPTSVNITSPFPVAWIQRRFFRVSQKSQTLKAVVPIGRLLPDKFVCCFGHLRTTVNGRKCSAGDLRVKSRRVPQMVDCNGLICDARERTGQDRDKSFLPVSQCGSTLQREFRLQMASAAQDRVRVGAFELDLKSGELCPVGVYEADGRVLLREQPFQVLRMLVERAGKIVTREEIKQKLWPNDTIVDFDHSINTTIKTLRRALGDSADNPQYIETLARRGYPVFGVHEWLEINP